MGRNFGYHVYQVIPEGTEPFPIWNSWAWRMTIIDGHTSLSFFFKSIWIKSGSPGMEEWQKKKKKKKNHTRFQVNWMCLYKCGEIVDFFTIFMISGIFRRFLAIIQKKIIFLWLEATLRNHENKHSPKGSKRKWDIRKVLHENRQLSKNWHLFITKFLPFSLPRVCLATYYVLVT